MTPIGLLQEWIAAARDAHPPWADTFALATSTPLGEPAVRMVVLRTLDETGLVFFTDERSRKGRELAANPRVAAVFAWPAVRRQVRVEGRARVIPGAEADELFRQRPRETRLPVHAWRQDETVVSRDELVTRLADVERRFEGSDVPRPRWWRGYRIRPDAMEFWTEDAHGLHERVAYRRSRGTWKFVLLAP
jgi:pyridoxamine 5'-phosphate oxidase